MKVVTLLFFLAFILLGFDFVRGQEKVGAANSGKVITVGEDAAVNAGLDDLPLVEPHLAVNPQNPQNMIAGAMVSKPDGSYGIVALATFDRGQNWKSQNLGIERGGDVWCAFLPDGTAVFSTLVMTKNDEVELHVFRSMDGGKTWRDVPVVLGGGHDHPTLAVDKWSKNFAGSLYAVSTTNLKSSVTGKNRNSIFVSRSANGAESFFEPKQLILSNLSYEAHQSVVTSDGTLFVPFADHHKSGDRRFLERQRDWLITSADGGKTFSEPMLISETCSGRGGWTSLAVSPPESRFKDRLYHLCSSQQFEGVQIRYSDTRGERWTDPIILGRPTNVTPYARTPAVAVNKDGIVGIIWYDARNDGSMIKGNFRCQEIFFAASLDGGETFLPEVKVSAQKSCPATARNLQTAMRFPAGGEYIGLDTSPDGTFHLLWADSRSGIYQLRTSIVTIAESAIR